LTNQQQGRPEQTKHVMKTIMGARRDLNPASRAIPISWSYTSIIL